MSEARAKMALTMLRSMYGDDVTSEMAKGCYLKCRDILGQCGDDLQAAMRQLHTVKLYFWRGNPLVYHGEPHDVPILTVANYCKWYELYLIGTDGQVMVVDFEEIQPYADEMKTDPFYDHVPNPEVVEAMCEARGWWLHEESHEMMIGRWTLEVKEWGKV